MRDFSQEVSSVENNVTIFSSVRAEDRRDAYFGFLISVLSIAFFYTIVFSLAGIYVTRNELDRYPRSMPSKFGKYCSIVTLIAGMFVVGRAASGIFG